MMRTIVLLISCLLASCSAVSNADSVAPPMSSPGREIKKDIPNDSWVKLFFEGSETETLGADGKIRTEKTGGIDEFARKNGFSILREEALPENDLEARVWVGFGKYGFDGFILRRAAGNWSAVALKGMICHLENKGRYDLKPPKSGWETAWQKMVEAEILTLPDSTKLAEYENGILDGKSFVVETNAGYSYRTYLYGNPNFVKLNEARQMVLIGQIIADEFGLESFSSGDCGENE